MRTDRDTATVGRISAAGGLFGSNAVGNLHIDSDATKTDGRIYLDWFGGRGIVFGNGAQGALAYFDTTTFHVPALANFGTGGVCCSGAGATINLAEATSTTSRLPTIQFHAAGVAEAQIVFAHPGYTPNGVNMRAPARRTVVVQSVQDRVDLYVTGDIRAGGTKNFVQPHPEDPDKEIVYTALEGGEAGTYARGSSQLVAGRAIVRLPSHFALVTVGTGITAQVTARGPCGALWVSEASPTRLVVESERAGASCAFDWLVQGVRRGFEERPVIVDRAR
jgi:hypothetical protein